VNRGRPRSSGRRGASPELRPRSPNWRGSSARALAALAAPLSAIWGRVLIRGRGNSRPGDRKGDGVGEPSTCWGSIAASRCRAKASAIRPPARHIFLYRRPILDYWCESGEDLLSVVRHVLIHEIGHHFGFSDADMERIENSP